MKWKWEPKGKAREPAAKFMLRAKRKRNMEKKARIACQSLRGDVALPFMPESVQSLLGETPGGANRAMLKDATHYVAKGKLRFS